MKSTPPLELFRKFIRFGDAIRPVLFWAMGPHSKSPMTTLFGHNHDEYSNTRVMIILRTNKGSRKKDKEEVDDDKFEKYDTTYDRTDHSCWVSGYLVQERLKPSCITLPSLSPFSLSSTGASDQCGRQAKSNLPSTSHLHQDPHC